MYEHIADSYNQLHGAEQTRKFVKLTRELILDEYESVVDVGCATAHLSKYFSSQVYLGVDPCKQLLMHAPENVHVVCAYGEALPLEDESADLVMSLTALHNYDDPIQGVRELARICSDTALVGVLKKSSHTSSIVSEIKKYFVIKEHLSDAHDELFVLCVRNV